MALTVGELQVIIEAQTEKFRASLTGLEGQVNNFAKTGEAANAQLASSFNRLKAAALGALAVFGVSVSIGALVDLSNEVNRINDRLVVLTGTVEEANKVFGGLRDVAAKSRTPLGQTVDLFVELSNATSNLGVSQARVANITELLNKTLALSGRDGGAGAAGIRSFALALQAGELEGANLLRIIRQTPALAKALADGLGVSIKELKALAEAGAISADVALKALEGQADSINDKFSKLSISIPDALLLIKNELLVFVQALEQASGFSDGLGNSIAEFSKGLADRLATGLQSVIVVIAKVIDGFADLVRALEATGADLFTVQRSLSILLETGIIVTEGLKTGFFAVRVAILSLIGAFKAAGNLVGLISDESLDSTLKDWQAATEELAAQAVKSGATINDELGKIGENLSAIFDSGREEDNRVSEGLKSLADNARKTADATVAALARIRNAREQLSTVPSTEGKTEDFVDKSAEEAFFRRLEALRKQSAAIKSFSDEVGAGLTDAVSAGFESGLTGVASSLTQTVQDALSTAFAKSVSGLVDELTKGLAQISPQIAELFGSSGGQGVGSKLIGATLGAIGTAGVGLLNAALQDSNVQTSADRVQSAVTSTQAVRGVVAGPTGIAVAEVARGIQDAFGESERLLVLIERNTRATAARVGGSGTTTAADDSTALLTNESESLI